jgi:dienelactone hydrolase
LTWVSTNTTACTASGSWTGTQPISGTFNTGALSAGASYTLTCTGAGGSVNKTANVTIQTSGAPTATSASTLGPLAVQTYTSGIVVPSGARFQQPTIWYPAGGAGPYPGVVFVPGYTSDYLNPKTPLDETDVIQWATFLASHGFVVMFINSANIATDGPPQKMNALLDAVDAFASEAARSGSPINGQLQLQNIAVMGHSFGGAAALFAANAGSNARISAVVALSPVPNNSSFGPYPNDTVPSLIFGGQGDPLYSGFQGEYDSIPSTTSKMLAIFNQANTGYSTMHNIARNPLGAHVSDPLVARYGLSFLEVYLAGDARYQQFLVTDPLLQSFSYNP